MNANDETSPAKKLEEGKVLELVDSKWRDAFLRFVRTGEAEPDFLAYLDATPLARDAVTLVFDAQASAWESLAARLSQEHSQRAVVDRERVEEVVSKDAEMVLEEIASLTSSEREGVVRRVSSTIANQEPRRSREKLAVVSAMASAMAGLITRSKE